MADPAAQSAREAHQRHEGLPGGLIAPEDASEDFLLRETAGEPRPERLVP